MSFVCCDMAVSVDGYTAGPNPTLERPFGDGPVEELTRWMTQAREENQAEVDGIVGADAYIMGRNMFGAGTGEWDLDWTGWWGEDPPYHAPVFVLAHREREPFTLEGGNSFTFVTGGVADAMTRATAVAGPDGRISIAGGAATVNQFLAAGLIDELRLHIAPVVLGKGTKLFDGVPSAKLVKVSSRDTSLVTHVTYRFER